MNDQNRPFWRVPVMWLVLGLPAAAVIASVLLLIVATRTDGGTDTVAEEVTRISRVQTSNLGPDAQAAELKLSAVLRVDEGLVQVIPVSGTFDRGATLHLILEHPALTSRDLRLELSPSEEGWHVESEVEADHDWIVQLTAADGSWRLRGRLPTGQQAARLAPALGQADQ